jgi:hypothetical protein
LLDQARNKLTENHWYWYIRGPIFLLAGDDRGYRQHLHSMIERFGDDLSAGVQDRLAKLGLALPDSGVDVNTLVRMAETGLNTSGDSEWRPYFVTTRALADYREGHYDEAIERVEHMSHHPGKFKKVADIYGRVIAAMSRHRLGHEEDVDRALAKLRRAIASANGLTPNDFGDEWWDWMIVRRLYHELLGERFDAVFPQRVFAD